MECRNDNKQSSRCRFKKDSVRLTRLSFPRFGIARIKAFFFTGSIYDAALVCRFRDLNMMIYLQPRLFA